MCILNVTKIKNIQNIQVMANQNKTDIGLIGLAVMGENLSLIHISEPTRPEP